MWTTPLPDQAGLSNLIDFGNAHSDSTNMALCDGSVRSVSYSIDPETHHRLCSRKDGKPIDGSKF